MKGALFAGLVLIAVTPQLVESSNRSRLEKVDWANRDYGRNLRLEKGRYVLRRYPSRATQNKMGCRHTTREARLIATHYGDLTGDRRAEAVVQIGTLNDNCRTSNANTVAIVFAYSRGKVIELARGSLPPRLTALRIAAGELRLEHTTAGLRCTERWKLAKTTLSRIAQRCK